MTFIIHPIQKAKKRPKWKNTRSGKRLFALGEAMHGSVRASLVSGLKTFKKRVSGEAVYQAWITGDFNRIMQAIPWENLPVDLEPSMGKLDKIISASSMISAEALPAPIQSNLRWDTKNPKLLNFIGTRTAENVVRIQDDTRGIIQRAVQRSFDQALTPDRVADLIRGSIGLYPRQEQALRNYKNGLLASGMLSSKVDRLGEAYESRLLDQRAMMIARTETRMANNVGQLAVWNSAANDDLIDRGSAKKVWMVDGNPCPLCDPMDGEAVGLDEYWTMEDGTQCMVPTESHPNCMCSMEIELGDSRSRLEQSTPPEEDE